MRTSAAMKKYIEQNRPNDVIRVVDTLEHIGHLYNKTVSEGYEIIAKNMPTVLYCLFKYAIAPLLILEDMAFISSVPSGALFT